MKDYVPSSSSASSYNYKPFIKNISIDQVSNDRRKSNETSNKTFFSNIKAQLNSIRTDVNKLVAKDAPRTVGSANKSYTMGSAQKADTGMDYLYDRNLQKRVSYDTNERASNPTAALELKISQLTSKLSEQTAKNQELNQQFQQERKNQQFLRDQVTSLRQNLSRAEQKITLKNKQIENCKLIYQKTSQQKQQYVKIIQSLKLELRKCSSKVQKVIQQDPQLQRRLKQKQQTIKQLFHDVERYKQQNRNLIYRLDTIQKDKQIQIAIVSKTYEQKLNRQQAKSFKQLGSNFELKINQLLNENYNLKNKISYLESQTQKDRVKIQSLQSTVEAFESRDRQAGQSTNEKQLQNLRNKMIQLQQQNDRLQSDHQYQIMKLQNTIDELKQSGKNNKDSQPFTQILKDQINQIQNLKQKLREKNQLLNKIKK